MGSEQSQQQNLPGSSNSGGAGRPNPARLQRGATIATAGNGSGLLNDNSPPAVSESRPVSPPMSVCSDSDLPYISYTDRPIGGDSPKLKNKGPVAGRSIRPSTSLANKNQQSIKSKIRPSSTAHNIVVVKAATREVGLDRDEDIIRLQNIPMFLPVMRSTLTYPSGRDPDILERLHPTHMINICSRLQTHFNGHATRVANDQAIITMKVKEIDSQVAKLYSKTVEKQKKYSQYAETFSKVRNLSQQLSRCNALLNQNIEMMDTLNNMLPVEDRLEPFVWKTNK